MMDSASSSINKVSPIAPMHELDEIAKLAGLKTEMNPQLPGDTNSPLTHAGCPVCGAEPCVCLSLIHI